MPAWLVAVEVARLAGTDWSAGSVIDWPSAVVRVAPVRITSKVSAAYSSLPVRALTAGYQPATVVGSAP